MEDKNLIIYRYPLNQAAKRILNDNGYNPKLRGALTALAMFCNQHRPDDEYSQFKKDYPEFSEVLDSQIIDQAIQLLYSTFVLNRDGDLYTAKQVAYLREQWQQGIVLEKAPPMDINVHDQVEAIIDFEEVVGTVIVKTKQEHSVSIDADIVKVNTEYMVRYQNPLGDWTVASVPQKFIIKKL